MIDSSTDAPLDQAWNAFGRSLAVAAGAASAIVALAARAGVLQASLRGAAVFAGVLVVARGGGWLIARLRPREDSAQ